MSYPFLSDPAQVQGRLEGDLLTLWTDSDFTRAMVGKPATLRAVKAAAAAILGRECPLHSVGGKGPAGPDSVGSFGPGGGDSR